MSRILLLEDDTMIASGILYALETEGYETNHATGIKVYNLRPTISAGRTQHPFPVLLVLLQHLGGNAKEQFAGNNRTGTGQAEKGKSRTNDT